MPLQVGDGIMMPRRNKMRWSILLTSQKIRGVQTHFLRLPAGAALRSRAHTAGAGFKPAVTGRRLFPLLLSGVVSCCWWRCCASRRCCSWSARAAEKLEAQRCSHRLSISRGILLTTKSPVCGRPGVKGLNARGPLKVPREVSGGFGAADRPFKFFSLIVAAPLA